jgi:hypothetical protein
MTRKERAEDFDRAGAVQNHPDVLSWTFRPQNLLDARYELVCRNHPRSEAATAALFVRSLLTERRPAGCRGNESRSLRRHIHMR